MALLTVQHTSGLTGLTPTFSAAAGGGDTFQNSGSPQFQVKNGGGSSITVTVAAQHACEQGVTHNVVATVAAGAHAVLGPFDHHYNNVAGIVSVTYSGVTSVTVAVTAA